MTSEEFLAELESLTHTARMQRMVELGRLVATDANAAATLAALEQGEFYGRFLAVQACYGSRDGAHVLRALGDASRKIRIVAMKLVALVCDDAQAEEALGLLTADQCRFLLRRLLKARRRTPIDAFLAMLAERRDSRLVLFLPFGSPAFVERHLEQVLPSAGYIDYRRLARLHPALVSAALLRQAAKVERLDRRLIWLANAVLPTLADTLPDEALALVRSLLAQVSLSQLDLAQLALRRPNEVADLALGTDDQPRIDFGRVAHRLDTVRLRALIERGALKQAREWLKRLKPEQRVVVYSIAQYGWRDMDGGIAPEIVELLPGELREREGRRHLALPVLAARPSQRLPYAALLPWDEARAVVDPFIHNPDPDLRIAGLAALIAAARFYREHLSDLLALVHLRRNEQDPVRLVMLAGIADLPPGRWQAEHLDGLGQVIRDALDAADLSMASANAIERLITRLLPFHPNWGVTWLATLVQERGQFNMRQMDCWMSDEDVRRIAPSLLPVLRSWETRERVPHLLAVAWGLGKRLKVFDALVEILERVLRETRAGWVASQALELLATYRPERLDDLVPALVADDPSWVMHSPIYKYLHRKRQDLITPFLGQTAYKGRFSTGKARFVLPLRDGFHRWTPAQQAIFAETLTQVTRDEKRDTPALWRAIEQLAALPAVLPTRLIELARASNRKVAIRDLALRALGRLDAGQGIPTLLEALDDERARVAIYALRAALLEMPPNRALDLLRSVPLDKVTVAKEVVRLLGELSGGVGYAALLEMEAQELHRDVRVALLRALWGHLEREETWPILERAARAPDPAIAAGVVRIPADRLSLQAQRRLASLIAVLLAHSDPKVRLDTLWRLDQLPLADTEQVLAASLAASLGSGLPDEYEAAANAILAMYVGRDAPLVGKAVESIMANRRALATMRDVLQAIIPQKRTQLLPTVRAVLAVLAGDPLTASMRAELAIMALPWDEVMALLCDLAARGELHSEALMLAVVAMDDAAQRPDAGGLARLEAAFRHSEDERLRRLGLAALEALGESRLGWNAERLALLQTYRADPSWLVAAAAQFVFPPVENE